jgi:hypothetical protein
VWERLTPFLAHRGWESWAPSVLAPDAPRSFAALADAVERVARAMPGPPIVVTHDAGVVLAADLVRRVAAPAVVVLAPVLGAPRASPFGRAVAWLASILSRGAVTARTADTPPRGRFADAFVGRAAGARERLVADAVLTAAVVPTVSFSPGPPGLVVAGDDDRISAPIAGELARRAGWETRVYRGRGHFLQLEPGWEEIGGEVHRWVVRTLGAGLLAMLDEDDES